MSTMRTRCVAVALLTLCLATLTIADPSSSVDEEEEFEDDLPSNRTSEDYDEKGELVTPTTAAADDGTTETDIGSDPNFGEEEASAAETTKGKDLKTKKIPDVGGGGGGRDADECGDPPSKENTRIERGRKSRYSVGDAVLYSCEYGYVTDGYERTAQCYLSEATDTLQWRQPNIICTPRSCGDPGYVSNGQRIGSVFTFPNRVSFECDEGYQLRGNAHRYCKTTGTWSGHLPTCERVMCDPPLSPVDGRVSFDSLEFGSELRYACDEGYLLRDHHHTRVCSNNGTWSGEEPTCQEAQCDPPVAPDFGTVQVVGGKSSVGSMAIYTCEGDRLLVGSATSKCLDIGQWTFPTPKCLEKCSVPKVPHGKIGRYVRKYRRLTFTNMEEGARIEDGSELYLTCDRDYEPFGTTNLEEKMTCTRGEWSRYPRCEPAACRLPPPITPNADRVSFNTSHGSGVTYFCNSHSRKTERGNVRCNFGVWTGKTPTCKDTRCDVEGLAFAGVKKEAGKRYYTQHESYRPVCEQGYTAAAKSDNKLICLNEQWKGHFPPCEPANCTSDPPSIANGDVVPNFSRLHTSEVSYECDEPYHVLKSSSDRVRCSFGEWTGTPPKCQDVRCYLDDLKKNFGVSIESERITDSGEFLQVVCDEGFTPTGFQPRCVDGEWMEPQPPCKENGCSIVYVNQGKITERVNKEKCNFFGRNCKYWHEFVEVGRNRKFSPGTYLYVTCDEGHTLHGKGRNNVQIQCSRGQWDPRLVCLRTGMPYREETVPKVKGGLDTSRQTERPPTGRPVDSTVQQSLSARTPRPLVVSTDERRPPTEEEDRLVVDNTNCSCTYINLDTTLAGYAGLQKLTSFTGVKNGCKVRFHCTPLGYYRLTGTSEFTCKDCRTWPTSEYPKCALPGVGDAVIRIAASSDYVELPGGVLGINKGSKLRLICIGNGVAIRPNWKTRPKQDVLVYNEDVYEQGFFVKSQVLEFGVIQPQHSGSYECAVQGYRPNSLEVQVITPDVSCPIFSEEGEFTVHYDRGQSFNSSAVFSCRNPSDRAVGSTVLTCMMNGQWSGDPPQCIKKCPVLQVEGGLKVIYSKGQEVDSTASFHCLLPSVRRGVPYTRCKRNGKWADPTPNCEVPSCHLESLYSAIPESVVPILEESAGDVVAYNASLQLKCVDDRRIVGAETTAKCGTEGKWQVPKVNCVSGCPAVAKVPDMLLDPDAEFYSVGELVTFSCVPGQVLSREVVRMMCLRGEVGPEWSEKDIPTCLPTPLEEHSAKKGPLAEEME